MHGKTILYTSLAHAHAPRRNYVVPDCMSCIHVSINYNYSLAILMNFCRKSDHARQLELKDHTEKLKELNVKQERSKVDQERLKLEVAKEHAHIENQRLVLATAKEITEQKRLEHVTEIVKSDTEAEKESSKCEQAQMEIEKVEALANLAQHLSVLDRKGLEAYLDTAGQALSDEIQTGSHFSSSEDTTSIDVSRNNIIVD